MWKKVVWEPGEYHGHRNSLHPEEKVKFITYSMYVSLYYLIYQDEHELPEDLTSPKFTGFPEYSGFSGLPRVTGITVIPHVPVIPGHPVPVPEFPELPKHKVIRSYHASIYSIFYRFL